MCKKARKIGRKTRKSHDQRLRSLPPDAQSALSMAAKKLTKSALLQLIASETDTDRRTAALFLDVITEIGYKEVKKNGEFTMPGFGKLVKQKRKARVGRNPATGASIKIPAKTVVKFRVAKAAKDAVLGAK